MGQFRGVWLGSFSLLLVGCAQPAHPHQVPTLTIFTLSDCRQWLPTACRTGCRWCTATSPACNEGGTCGRWGSTWWSPTSSMPVGRGESGRDLGSCVSEEVECHELWPGRTESCLQVLRISICIRPSTSTCPAWDIGRPVQPPTGPAPRACAAPHLRVQLSSPPALPHPKPFQACWATACSTF